MLGSNGEIVSFIAIKRDITERKRAEQALHDSEERFRTMADSSPSMMWVTDTGGKVEFVNRALREFCGAACEEVEGGQWHLPLHPEDAPEYFAAFDRAAKEHTSFEAEARVRRADGEWRLVGTRAEPQFSPGGEYIGHIGLSADITERKQAEQALLESENRFRIMADSCPIGIWVTDAQGRTLFMNRTYRKFFGGSSQDVEQDAWQRLLHLEDEQAFRKSFRHALNQHTSFKAECRCRRSDGEWRWVETFADPRFSQDNEFLGLVGTSKDITERKQVEADLVRAREDAEAANRELSAQHAILDKERKMLRAFIDIVPDYMYVKDIESRFILANLPVTRWAGAEKPEDLLGKTDFDFCPREFASRYYEDEQRVIRSEQPIFDQEETSVLGGTNEVAYRLTTKVPLFR